MTTVDWSALDDKDVQRAITAAARIVSGRYKGRAVAMLAEREDLEQEARIMVATRPAMQGIEEDLLRFRLVQRLGDKLRGRADDAKHTVSLDAMAEADRE